MKNTFFAIVFFAILFGSCRNNSSKPTGTHTHDDGSVHTDHEHLEEKMPKQELFEVEIDSLLFQKDTLSISKQKIEHSHNGGHPHKH